MDPNSSTFCVNYLSQFPLIKPETINTLCFNGFTNYHQLSQLDVDSDLPCIRDISDEQKAAVKRALARFANQGQDDEDGPLTSQEDAPSSSSISYQSQQSSEDSLVIPVTNGDLIFKSNLITTSSEQEQNSFYLAKPIEPTPVATTNTTGILQSIDGEPANVQSYESQSSSSIINPSSSVVVPASSSNFASSSGATVVDDDESNGSASKCATDVVSVSAASSTIAALDKTDQLIPLEKNGMNHTDGGASGGSNDNLASSNYVKIDQSNEPGQSLSSCSGSLKLGEAEANNCTANSTDTSFADDAPTTTPHSSNISLPSPTSIGQESTSQASAVAPVPHSSSNASPSSSFSTIVQSQSAVSDSLAIKSEDSTDGKFSVFETLSDYNSFINKKFRRTTPESKEDCKSPKSEDLEIKEENIDEECATAQSDNIHSSAVEQLDYQKDDESELIIDDSEANSKQSASSSPSLCSVPSTSSATTTPSNNLESESASSSTPQVATRMPYTIFEQLDCTKKLENGEKPLLSYHCGGQDSGVQDIKKDNLISGGNNNNNQGAEAGGGVVYSLSSMSTMTANVINGNATNGGNNHTNATSHTSSSLPISVVPVAAATSSTTSNNTTNNNVNMILSYSNGSALANNSNSTTVVASGGGGGCNETSIAGSAAGDNTTDSVVKGNENNNNAGVGMVSSVTDTHQLHQQQQHQQQQQQHQHQQQQQPSNASSTQFVNSLQLSSSGGNMVVSSISPSSLLSNPTASTNLTTISTAAALASVNQSNNEQLQIRDYLSEINVLQPASTIPNGNVVSNEVALQQQQANNASNTILTNSVTNFLSAQDQQQLLKNGSILVDQNGHPIDPNFNSNYVYSTVQLQLAPTGEVQRTLDSANKSQTSPLFTTLGTSNIGQQATQTTMNQVTTTQPATPQPKQQTPSPRRGRGRPKKYTDPLSLAVEQCLENSNSPTNSSTPTPITILGGPSGTTTIYRCRYSGCSFQSSDVLEFRNHNRNQHRDESTIIPPRKGKGSAAASLKEPLMCEVPGCGYAPKYRRLLIDHQNAHKGLRAHKCCFCEYNSSYFGDIRKHMIKRHPELAQEIKACKIKLKQGNLEGGKNSKLSKQEIDELSHQMATEVVKAKRSSSSSGQGSGEPGRRRTYNRNKRAKKENKTAAATATASTDQVMTQQLSTVSTSQAYAAITANEPKATTILSNLSLPQGQAQQQYSFMPSYGLQMTGAQADLTGQGGLTTANYGTLNPNLMGQTIIYLQASPSSGNVQLAAAGPNDMSHLNQIISYTDLNGQILTGHQGLQNLNVSNFGQPTSICLDGSTAGGAQGTTLAFVTDPSQAQSAGQVNTHPGATTTIYKCDMCFFQSDHIDQVMIHKHTEHSHQQQQQIAIIDASTLASMQAQQNSSQQGQDHHQHQLTYALAPSSTVTSSANFVHTLDYASLATATASIANANVGANVATNSINNGQTMTNMIFTSDPNALYFNAASLDHSTGTIDSNGLVTIAAASSMGLSATTTSLVAATSAGTPSSVSS